MTHIVLDGDPLPFNPGDSVLTAMLRQGQRPMRGGCLCCAGDCGHCLATVNGVAYVRTCQTQAQPGMQVASWPEDNYPALPARDTFGAETPIEHRHCDVVIIGQGDSGRAEADALIAAGKRVVTLDSARGEEAVSINQGPLVVARTPYGVVHVHAGEVVVATGAMWLQPIAPGNELSGIYTTGAIEVLHKAGVPLGKIIAVGVPPAGVDCEQIDGEIVRFEGGAHVECVIVRNEEGRESRHRGDSIAVGLGTYPRNVLARMGAGLAVRAIGGCANEAIIPPCPAAGTVCSCSGVAMSDLQYAWDHGFKEMELLKRATLAGTGTCQGGMCIPYLRSFLLKRSGTDQAPFTARPVARQLTLGEAAAGAHHRATPRTALDAEHRALGAYMDRIGGWWRPYRYGHWQDEYWAVREAVSIGDVSTLGKMQLAGPDALELLQRLYPIDPATIKPDRSRYVLMLDDRGYVMDDGLICNDGDGRYTLTFTSGGVTTAEMWMRDWIDAWGLDIRLLNQTMSLGAINVTGPYAKMLLERGGFSQALKFMDVTNARVFDVPCRVYRLSFTGEASYELHHPAEHSPLLWRRLMDAGRDLGIRPHGIEALLKLRLEKGHIIVGQDTDFDSTPRRIAHEWAVKLDRVHADGSTQDFVGRQAIMRTNKQPLDKQLCALEMDDRDAPLEGSLINHIDGSYAGYVTSCTWSPALKKTVALGWVRLIDGALPERVVILGKEARRTSAPFYDKEGARARA
jgi:glycine cleavage system aminomethyltransferase T